MHLPDRNYSFVSDSYLQVLLMLILKGEAPIMMKSYETDYFEALM